VNYYVGPLLCRLFRVELSGEWALVANLDADLPNNKDDFTILPSEDIIMLTRGVVGPANEQEIGRKTSTGEKVAFYLTLRL